VNTLRKLVPRPIRRGVSVQLAEMQAQRLERDLRGLVAQRETIVAGPWLGEVGFELLYWVPFLRWFAERFRLAPDRLLVVSRGGTASWYRPFAAGYREIFDHVPVDEFRTLHDERVAANGEQKQTRVLEFEHRLLRRLTTVELSNTFEDLFLETDRNRQLRSLVVTGVEAVYGGGFCTFAEATRFFSHRREAPCGRMATLVWLS